MKYLIDTNILIDHLRGDARATSFLESVENGREQAAISVITEYEILVGVKDSRDQEKINLLLKIMPIFTVTSSIVRSAAHFHRTYKIGVVDAIIAATANKTKTALLTRNTKHFKHIKEIRIKSI